MGSGAAGRAIATVGIPEGSSVGFGGFALPGVSADGANSEVVVPTTILLRRTSAPRRAAALLLAAFGGALLPVCSAGTGELPSPAAAVVPPRLIIAFEGALPQSAGERSGDLPSETKAALEDVRARLQLGSATAVAGLDFRSRSLASATGEKAQIDVRMKGEQRFFGMRRFSLRDPAAVDFQNEPLCSSTCVGRACSHPESFSSASPRTGTNSA